MINANEKISFLIENMFLATNAVATSLYSHDSRIVAEIGNLDMDLIGKNFKYFFPVIDNITQTCAKNIDTYSFNIIKKNNLSVLCVRLNDLFFLVSVYSKDVDINKNIDVIEHSVLNIKKYLDDLKNSKDTKNVIY